MNTIKYSETPNPWGSPTGIELTVQEYVDDAVWVYINGKRTRLQKGDLWVQIPDSTYVRIAKQGQLQRTQLTVSATIPGTLQPVESIPRRYPIATVGTFGKQTATIYLDGKRIPEPILILPGTIYLNKTIDKPLAVSEYYYTFGLRTEVVYSSAFDEYQCGQKMKISFYTRGLTVIDRTNFVPSRKKEFCQRVLGYYILHQLRTH